MTASSNQLQLETVLVKECKNGDRKAQHQLYNLYAGKMYAVCMRYTKNADDAQDALQDGFLKVFKNIGSFRGEGSLEGWVRRIFIYNCIEIIRKKNLFLSQEFSDKIEIEDKELTGFDKIAMQELMGLIQKLPDGYRTVLNLFMVEGYRHKEISELLGISESTSKSQLFRAKASLQKEILMLKN